MRQPPRAARKAGGHHKPILALPSVFALVAGVPVTAMLGGEDAALVGTRAYQRPAVVETVKVVAVVEETITAFVSPSKTTAA